MELLVRKSDEHRILQEWEPNVALIKCRILNRKAAEVISSMKYDNNLDNELFIKNRTKQSSNTLLCFVQIFMDESLLS